MIDARRKALHDLLDAVPPERLNDAQAALEKLADPLLAAFLSAPEDDEPLTEEDLRAIDEGKSDLMHGRTVSLDDIEQAFLRSA